MYYTFNPYQTECLPIPPGSFPKTDLPIWLKFNMTRIDLTYQWLASWEFWAVPSWAGFDLWAAEWCHGQFSALEVLCRSTCNQPWFIPTLLPSFSRPTWNLMSPNLVISCIISWYSMAVFGDLSSTCSMTTSIQFVPFSKFSLQPILPQQSHHFITDMTDEN